MKSEVAEETKIRVLFFGAARDVVASNQLVLSLSGSQTVETAFAQLVRSFPDLERFGRSLLFAVNQEYATRETPLRNDDELAIFPPVSGGK